MNQNRANGPIFDGPPTPGGSAQTFKGLCNVLERFRPDLLIYENVEDMAHAPGTGTSSDLDIARKRWNQLGYDMQRCTLNSQAYGLPQNRLRLYIVAFNTRDPKKFSFHDRSPQGDGGSLPSGHHME